MEIEIIRYRHGKDFTSGLLLIDCTFECHTLEDEYRNKKVYGETRIPEGTYEIKFRKEGGFHNRYKNKFGRFHKGMLELQDVPNFQYILIHIGNTDEDTAGCILVGETSDTNGFIGRSTEAYKKLYPKIAAKLEGGEKVFITIKDL